MSKSGVYLLKCRDCSGVYIGETGRKFHERINDHVNAYEKNVPGKSNFAKHLLEEGHLGDEEKILHFEGNHRRRTALETIEIIRYSTHHECKVLNQLIPNDLLIKKVYSTSPYYEETNL